MNTKILICFLLVCKFGFGQQFEKLITHPNNQVPVDILEVGENYFLAYADNVINFSPGHGEKGYIHKYDMSFNLIDSALIPVPSGYETDNQGFLKLEGDTIYGLAHFNFSNQIYVSGKDELIIYRFNIHDLNFAPLTLVQADSTINLNRYSLSLDKNSFIASSSPIGKPFSVRQIDFNGQVINEYSNLGLATAVEDFENTIVLTEYYDAKVVVLDKLTWTLDSVIPMNWDTTGAGLNSCRATNFKRIDSLHSIVFGDGFFPGSIYGPFSREMLFMAVMNGNGEFVNGPHLYTKDPNVMMSGGIRNLDFRDTSKIFFVGSSNLNGIFPGNYTTSLSIYNTTASGFVNWEKHYGDDAIYQPWTLKTTNDGGAIILSSRYEHGVTQPNRNDMHILKIDSLGNSTFLGIVDRTTKQLKPFKIYPNPARDFISIDLLGQTYNQTKLILTDAMGRVVLKQSFETKEKVDVSHLAAANYVLQIDLDGKWFSERIVMQ